MSLLLEGEIVEVLTLVQPPEPELNQRSCGFGTQLSSNMHPLIWRYHYAYPHILENIQEDPFTKWVFLALSCT